MVVEDFSLHLQQPPKKRTRFLQTKQSKLGCYTCKERKIKCTEEKPICSRCIRSGKHCAGYPPDPTLLASGNLSNAVTERKPPSATLSLAIASKPWARPEQEKLSRLAYTVLTSDPHGTHSPAGIDVFSYILPQLSSSVPFVHAAAAAFGAAYNNAFHIGPEDHRYEQLSTKLYGEALRLMRHEIQSNAELLPVLMACILLAASESIQQRHKDALSHMLGAFSMLQLGTAGMAPDSDDQGEKRHVLPDSQTAAVSETLSKLDTMYQLFRSLDIEVITFLWGKPPYLPAASIRESALDPKNVRDLIEGHADIIHRCLHFVADVNSDALEYKDPLPLDSAIKQGYLVSWLRTWLNSYRSLVEVPDFAANCKDLDPRYLRILKAQALSMLIAISNTRMGSQMAYDSWPQEFEEIIRCAEYVLKPEDGIWTSMPKATGTRPAYTPGLGIIPPLILVARKYRHSLWRRKAIALLQITGIEGPFNGIQEAAVAYHIVELEEGRPYSPTLSLSEIRAAQDIPDHKRAWGCWRVGSGGSTEELAKTVQFCCNKDLTGVTTVDLGNDADWISWEETIGLKLSLVHEYGTCSNLETQDTGCGNHGRRSYWSHPL